MTTIEAQTMSTRKSVSSTKPPAVNPATSQSASSVAPEKVKRAARAANVVAIPTKAPKKLKRVHDSFTMPALDYALIGALKQRAGEHHVTLKKNEILRAGLHVLSALATEQFVAAITAIKTVKAQRPKKN